MKRPIYISLPHIYIKRDIYISGVIFIYIWPGFIYVALIYICMLVIYMCTRFIYIGHIYISIVIFTAYAIYV